MNFMRFTIECDYTILYHISSSKYTLNTIIYDNYSQQTTITTNTAIYLLLLIIKIKK